MRYEDQFFRNDNSGEAWSRFCGFLTLSLDDFCEVQRGLLNEQIEKVFTKPAFKKLMGGKAIKTIDEFRESVPFNAWADYEPFFRNEKCEFMENDTDFWVHTSATRGTFKRIPWSQRFLEVQQRNVIGAIILSGAREEGDVQLYPGCHIMNLLPDMPFVSAHIASAIDQGFTVKCVPPLKMGKELNFNQKIDTAIELGLRTNVDFVIAMTSSLLRIGPRFGKVWRGLSKKPGIWFGLSPRVAFRIFRTKSKNEIWPKNAWRVKGILCWGTDSTELEKTVHDQWGRTPIQMYGSSEGGIMASQDWNRGPLALFPNSVFFEFIPEDQINKKNPTTKLINELEDGKCYELVLTSFYEMPMVRYRQGDLVRVTRDNSRKDKVPRISILGRADNTIDIFGIARLNDTVISEALSLNGLSASEWCLHKEYVNGKSLLNIFLEMDHVKNTPDLKNRISRSLKSVDRHWAEAVYTMAYNPIEIKPVPVGTFQQLKLKSKIGETTCFQINPPEEMIEELKRLG
ncbi:MAG: GH3 auxin-responsive promoter family protein [Dehalococcoidales bacterium]|nr:GH3 auxin-responsive promoter family protein [Dehalococcoidales bacterium]